MPRGLKVSHLLIANVIPFVNISKGLGVGGGGTQKNPNSHVPYAH
jgi:hypothetical protein